MPAKKPRRAPIRASLTKAQALRAAVALADEEGVTALSMRKLAERLGVKAMSLYHHVSNKDEILDGMVDLIFEEIEWPRGAAWRAAMRLRMSATREVLLRHGWAVALLESRCNPGYATLSHHDATIGNLRAGGFSLEMCGHALAVMDSYVYGFVLQEINLPFSPSREVGEVAEEILEDLPPDQLPHLAEFTRTCVLQPGYAYSDEFEFGLELILDGLEARRDP